MSSENVWLGDPMSEGDADVSDPFVSRIGGKATLLRACSAEESNCPAAFTCPKCRSKDHVSALAQLYAPLECYDRVLYILTCSACGVPPGPRTHGTMLATAPPLPATANPSNGGRKGDLATTLNKTSFCFAVRSQNFNKTYYNQLVEERRRLAEAAAKAEVAAAAAAADKGSLLFKESDDWGADDWGDEPTEDVDNGGSDAGEAPEEGSSVAENTTGAAAPQPQTLTMPELQEVFALAPNNTTVPLKGRVYTNGLPLELYVEPAQPKEKLGSTEEQLADAQRRYGVEAGTLDTTSFEEDDETPAERVVREYVERIERSPSQCVRWCPGTEPLRASLMPSLQSIPACPYCRAPRRFECQLTAPSVYFLTKGIGESKNADLHYSNVIVFTCSQNCYARVGYLAEYVVVEDEI